MPQGQGSRSKSPVKGKSKTSASNLESSRKQSGSQESLLQDEENPKLSRARQRTQARFESLLQAATAEGTSEETGTRKKKKQRTKTADTLLSEIKSGKAISKGTSRSEENLQSTKLYEGGESVPKIKKKRAKQTLQEATHTDETISDEISSVKRKGGGKSRVRRQRPKSSGELEEQTEKLIDRGDTADAGKENVAYDGSPERRLKDEADEPTGSTGKKRAKKKKAEPAADKIVRALETKRRDNGYLLSIEVHKADRLKPDIRVYHPVVRVHVVDIATGCYVKKSSRTRNVTSYFEGKNEAVDFIMPLMSQPFDFKKHRTLTPAWEEVLIYNEIYSYFLQRENDDPEIIIFFEILDFLTIGVVNRRENTGSERGWYKIAWAFLKVISTNGSSNTDRKIRLQLYHPQTIRRRAALPEAVEVYNWWKFGDRSIYPSTLYVTVKGIRPPDNIDPATRSMFPIQGEKGRVTFEELSNNLEGQTSRNRLPNDTNVPIWSRLPGQANRIPNKLSLILPTGRKGCSVARFSNDGKLLACACAAADGFPIIIYEIPSGTLTAEFSGHFGIVYDMSWSPDNNELLSASSDGTVRSWDTKGCVSNAIKVYPHPSFVYAAKHHPQAQQICVTGGFDHVIRVWSKMTDNLHGQLLREMTGHSGLINCICFDNAGERFYSGDSKGVIIEWTCSVAIGKGRKSRQISLEDTIQKWSKLNITKLEEIKGTHISRLKLHPGGRKLLIHSRDNFIRMLDLRSNAIMKRYLGATNYKEHIRSTMTSCGSFVLAGSEDGTCHVWNTETGDEVFIYNEFGYTNAVSDVDFHPHDNIVVFCSFGGGHPVLVYIFDPKVHLASTKLKDTQVSTMNQTQDIDTFRPDSTGILSSMGPLTITTQEPNGTQADTLRMDKVKQKLSSVLLDTTATPINRTSDRTATGRIGASPVPGTTVSTWGSDFSSYAAGNPSTNKKKISLPSPHAIQHLGASSRDYQRQLNESQDPSLLASPSQPAVVNSYFGSIEAQFQDSPLRISQLQHPAKPIFSFNAGAIHAKRGGQKRAVIAIYEYTPNRADELWIRPNDTITVLYQDNENWWMGELPDGRQGYFPANYVMEQEDLREVPVEATTKKSHVAVMSKGGDLKILSAPEDSDEQSTVQKQRQRIRKRDKRRSPRKDVDHQRTDN